MSSACWMTRSRSFSSEMDRQLERVLCSSPQFMGLLIVTRTGQSNTAKRTSCRAVGHRNSYIQIELTKGPYNCQNNTSYYFIHIFLLIILSLICFLSWVICFLSLPVIVQILVVSNLHTFSVLPVSFIEPKRVMNEGKGQDGPAWPQVLRPLQTKAPLMYIANVVPRRVRLYRLCHVLMFKSYIVLQLSRRQLDCSIQIRFKVSDGNKITIDK